MAHITWSSASLSVPFYSVNHPSVQSRKGIRATQAVGLLGISGTTSCPPPLPPSPPASIPGAPQHLNVGSRLSHPNYSGSPGDSSGSHHHKIYPVGHREACVGLGKAFCLGLGKWKGVNANLKHTAYVNSTLTLGKGQQLEVPDTVRRHE